MAVPSNTKTLKTLKKSRSHSGRLFYLNYPLFADQTNQNRQNGLLFKFAFGDFAISNVIKLKTFTRPRSALDRDELKLIADYLDALRKTSEGSHELSHQTASELDEYLGLAEAALRRARAELDA